MIAPSFLHTHEITSEVFTSGERNFVKVRNPKTDNERSVRWYSEADYAKAYPDDSRYQPSAILNELWDFDKGPILVVRGVRTVADETLLKSRGFSYAPGLGWHLTSGKPLQGNYPAKFKFTLLGWKEFKGDTPDVPKRPVALANIISKKIRDGKTITFKEVP